MKKLLATVSAVVLSLAMVAMPSVATADEVESTEPVTTETVTTETTEPDTTEPETTEPETTEPEPAAQTASILSNGNEPKDNEPTSDQLCTDVTDDSYEDKVDANANDPFSVSIPSGYTLVAYCVKAGTVPVIIDSNDDSPNDGTLPFVGPGDFVIDHPNKDSVSHYQLKLVKNEIDPGCDDLTGGRGASISVDEECPKDVVTVQGSAVNQSCEASGDESVGTPVNGSITLTVSDLDGVTKIEYKKDGGSLVDVPLNDLTIDNLAPGSYEFFVTVATDYKPVTNFTVTVHETHDPECNKQTICHWTPGGQGELGKYVEIDVSIKSIIKSNGHDTHEFDIIPPFDYYDGENLVSYPGSKLYDPEKEGCGDYQFPTEGPVIPEVVFTPATCDTNGSFTLISPPLTEGVPADVVTWFVNGVETEPGTYSVEVGEVITVKVVANYEEFPLDMSLPGGFVPEFTYPAYEFTAPTACDLNTLALTGAGDTTPALALTAFLGLLGLAMVRSGMRVNRNRQEA